MLWHPLFSFTTGEAVVVEVDPAIWGAVADYFYRQERKLVGVSAKKRKAIEEEVKREAEEEIARIAAKAKARDMEELSRRVESATLAFREFYRDVINRQVDAAKARKIAADAERAAGIERQRAEIAMAVAALEAEARRIAEDDDDVIALLMAVI